MSLINNMLRDLDRRGEKNHDASGDDGQQTPAVYPEHGGRRLWFPVMALALASASLCLLVWRPWGPTDIPAPSLEMINDNTPMARGQPTDSSAIASPTIREASAPAPQSAVDVVHTAASESELVSDNEGRAQRALRQAEVGRLLAEAELALGRDRLTSPMGDNAYDRYRDVLHYMPEHPEALAGIERIVRRYLTLIENQLVRRDWATAESLLVRAQVINPTHPELASVAQHLQMLRRAETMADAEPVQAEPTAAQNATEADDAATEARLEVTRNTAHLDESQAKQARELLQQGRQQQAQEMLEQWLERYPHSPHSVAELIGIYIDQGETDAALARLARAEQAGDEFFAAGEGTRLWARLDLAQGQTARAIERLEADLAESQQNERYRALLAGLYYRADRHGEAASAYRRLLDSFGSQSGYWLGLALALDAQQQDASALEAYRRALTNGYYDTRDNRDVRAYIEQRMTALGRGSTLWQ